MVDFDTLDLGIPRPDETARSEARLRQGRLTKPPGSLGMLEELAIAIAAWQGTPRPSARPAVALLFAADHPVTVHGVSAYPAEVTRAMLENFAAGGAAANVLARFNGLPLSVVDVGVHGPATSSDTAVVRAAVADDPAGDIRLEDAMSRDTYERAFAAGKEAVDSLGSGLRVLVLGEMGIGNTTVASVVAALLLGGDARDYAGAGTGMAGEALERKRRVVADAVARVHGERDPREVLRRAGGRELVALTGAMARALEQRAVVLVDGFIVSVAALALVQRAPSAARGLVFAHRSAEHAHGRVLEAMDAHPLLSLGMRLGEASGALAAYPLVELACRLHGELATFESAKVPDRAG